MLLLPHPCGKSRKARQGLSSPKLEGIYGIADLVPVSESSTCTQYREHKLVLRVEAENAVIGQVALSTCDSLAQPRSRQDFKRCWVDFKVVVVQGCL